MIDSIGCAIYNRPDLLQRLIDSIDYPVGRFIIVNNGCLNIPKYQNGNVANFDLIDPGQNLGCAGGWNCIQDRAFTQLNLESVLICGNDIRFESGDLQIFSDTLRDFPQADFVFGNHSFGNFLVKRSGWEKVGAFWEECWPAFLEDGDFWQRVIRTGSKAIHAAGLRCAHEGSASLNSASKEFQKVIKDRQNQSWIEYGKKWGCPEWSTGKESFATPYNLGGNVNEWKLSERRLAEPHFFKQWPQ